MKLSNPDSRSTEEWIGKTNDSPVPDEVKVRVFKRYGGKCYLSGVKIMGWDRWEVEHVRALSLGGENRESNLAPALVEPHKEKTKSDRRVLAKAKRVERKHLGIKKRKSRPIPGSKRSGLKKNWDGTVEIR